MKKYNVIYADPPWSYSQKNVGRGNKSGSIDNYDVLRLEDIKLLPISTLAQDDAILFMWATVPLLPDCLSVIPEWGFTYKTVIVWEKTGILGMGNWVRVQEELLLIAVRGKVKPFKHQEKNIYRQQICKHSAKPQFFRNLIERLAFNSNGFMDKVELFARSRDGMFSDYEYEGGWDVFGNQVNNSIVLPKPTK